MSITASFSARLMYTFLAGEGFGVESCDNVSDANFAISSGTAAMVITALTFADMSGEEFLQKINDFYAGPVIVISSSITAEKEKELLELGAKAAINKSGSWQEQLKPHLAALV